MTARDKKDHHHKEYALVIDSIDHSLWVMFLLWAIQLAPHFNKWAKADAARLDEVSDPFPLFLRLRVHPTVNRHAARRVKCGCL